MDIKKILPHVYAALTLMLVSAIVFAPNAFSGKVLPQPDNDKARGMQTEIHQYIAKDGKAPLWTNSAFGGMPAYQIYSPIEGNLTVPVYKTLFLWSDITSVWAQVFVAMICLYFLLQVLGVHWLVAVLGAVGYGITTYNVDILEAGHSTKMAALALAPGAFAGGVLLFRGRYLLGASLLALFIAMQLYANHVQITYYTLLLLGFWGVAAGVEAVLNKQFKTWLIAAGLSVVALGVGFSANLSRIWPTYEYGQETIRGKSDLAQKSDKGDGLDKDYLFGWSYGIAESFTLLVPHFAGGGAGESMGDTRLYKAIARQLPPNMTKRQAEQQVAALMYTGDQPFVGTAIYFGAVIVFLSLLGAFLAPGAPKWWLLSGGIFTIMLAWGKNFFLNDILYDVLPMFNKFRAVSMALGIGQLCFAALAALGVQAFLSGQVAPERKRRALFWSGGIAAGLCLLAIVFAGSSGPNDGALAQNPELLDLLSEDRAALVRGDAFRSMAFIAVAFGLLWFYLRGSLKAVVTAGILTVLALADHWTVCTRTLRPEKWENKKQATAAPQPEPFDQQIKQDPDIHYRVLDLSRGGITGNAITSYFHKSLSGYHAAKLQRFQEVVDTFLTANLEQNLHIVGMLNGKYIVTPQKQVLPNDKALGHAWFVSEIEVVPTADAEMQGLHALNPREKALVSQEFAGTLAGFQPTPDSNATIELTSYHPDKMAYMYSAASDQFAVFPEMYYPPAKGWKCYLNGQPAPDFIKVNYLLRGMRLPAGQNQQLEMRFEPRSFYTGEMVARVASLLTLLAFFLSLWLWYRTPGASMAAELVDATPGERPARPQAAETTPTRKPAPKKKR
ncbi:MAG: hypothetical protein SFV52_08850 [Saprospiraceae bacterium]|nr:hypothetical protein [Saprospiraceae bacterium]